jgi:glutathione S-transferase
MNKINNEKISVYINPLTVNSIKVLLFCNLLEIKPNFKIIALQKQEQRKASFLAINPDGKVPVLIDDTLVLSESNAILQYLAAKHTSDLWPASITQQAQVLRVLFWQSNYFNSAISTFSHRKVVMPFWGFETDNITTKQIAKFHEAVSALEIQLKSSKFVAGDNISIADISLSAFFIFAEQAQMPLTTYPMVKAWLHNMSSQRWFINTQEYLNSLLLNKLST